MATDPSPDVEPNPDRPTPEEPYAPGGEDEPPPDEREE
jgi:hypothetical protein